MVERPQRPVPAARDHEEEGAKVKLVATLDWQRLHVLLRNHLLVAVRAPLQLSALLWQVDDTRTMHLV
jgi:hypothetical protein